MQITCLVVSHSSHYIRMFSVLVFMHGQFCPIRLIRITVEGNLFITVRNSSCGKVKFFQASVWPQCVTKGEGACVVKGDHVWSASNASSTCMHACHEGKRSLHSPPASSPYSLHGVTSSCRSMSNASRHACEYHPGQDPAWAPWSQLPHKN